MTDLPIIIKDYVSSVCKTADEIEVLISDNIIIINNDNTALSIIPLNLSTGLYVAFNYFEYISSGISIPINNIFIFNKLLGLWQTYESMTNSCPIEANIEDLRSIPEYEELLALKASEGMGFFRIPGNQLYQNYLLPVFTGFPNLNKSDKVGIIVKRIDYGTLLMEYHIYKKKINKNFVMYFRTVDMNRKLIDEQFKIR